MDALFKVIPPAKSHQLNKCWFISIWDNHIIFQNTMDSKKNINFWWHPLTKLNWHMPSDFYRHIHRVIDCCNERESKHYRNVSLKTKKQRWDIRTFKTKSYDSQRNFSQVSAATWNCRACAKFRCDNAPRIPKYRAYLNCLSRSPQHLVYRSPGKARRL